MSTMIGHSVDPTINKTKMADHLCGNRKYNCTRTESLYILQ